MKQEERSQETRQRILTAAESSFGEHGYDVSSVDAICRTAGVSKGAFYHHFPSKGSVFVALLDTWLAQMDDGLRSAQKQGGTVPEQIAVMADVVDDVYRLAGMNWNILLEFWAKAKTDPEIAGSMVAMLRRYQGFFEQILRQGEREGTIHTNDTSLAATLLLSVVLGMLLQGILDPAGQEWGTTMKRSLNLFVKSINGGEP